MTSAFAPELINGPFGDPGLYISLPRSGTALIVDLGNLDRFPAAKIHRTTHVFISHTHIDHFVGFDRLLRLLLNRDTHVKLYGPPEIIRNVKGKLDGYTWNLIDGYPLTFEVFEVDVDEIRCVRLSAASAFSIEPLCTKPFAGEIFANSNFSVQAVHLNHRIPSLAFAVQEARRVNVRKPELERSGLRPGAWLDALKEAVRTDQPPESIIDVPSASDAQATISHRLDSLRDQLIDDEPGEKIVYVVDAGFTAENVARIVDLARDSDVFFCESPFLDEDREQARHRFHLTARQAGSLAHWANARRLCTFHFSPRYSGKGDRLVSEANAAYAGELQADDPY